MDSLQMRRTRCRRFIGTLILMLATLVAQNVSADDRLLAIDDILSLPYVGAPVLSPDGQWVAYTVDRVMPDDDEYRTTIYMLAVKTGERVQMTNSARSASAPQWSPDSRYLAFMAADGDDDNAVTQVFTLDRRGGEAIRYTNIPQGVENFAWSPDGARMLLSIRDMSEGERADRAAREAGDEPKPRPWVIDRLQFKQDGKTYLDRSRLHLYIVGDREAEPLQLTFGDYEDRQPAWRPDGREIVYVSNRDDEPDRSENTDLWVVSAEGKDATRESRRLTTNPGSDHSPAWSHDGRRIAYVSSIEPDLIWYATNHLAIVDRDGRNAKVLSKSLDRNVGSPHFTADDSAILFLLEDSAERHLASWSLKDNRATRLVKGKLAVKSFDLTDAGDIAIAMSTATLPTEIFSVEDGKTKQLSHETAGILAGISLASTRDVQFKSADGTAVEGMIVLPPGYTKGKRYPTLLRIHGGPVSQYELSFNRDAQLFAANGYVVVMANPRGSSGYGQAFSAALFANWGVPDFADEMAAVDYAIEEGYADPDKLGVGGWSYGGILTNYVITKSTRFKGAISGASEVLFTSNYGHDHYQREWEMELGLPWEHRDAWERITPFYDVGKVTTPTLIMGGKDDWNVPILNSEQLYEALKRRGIKTKLVVYPGQTHGFTRPSFIHDRYERYLAWYGETVRGEE